MQNLDTLLKYTSTLKLLYIEDNKDARETTHMILEDFFDEIVVAVNGQDGYDKFMQNDIDLIITDINMPILNGLDMIYKIRESGSNVSILVLSAYNESGYFMESIKLGVEGYLLKPIDLDQFLSTLEKVVEKIKLKQDIIKSNNLLEQYKEITDKSAIITVLDKDNIITYANDAFCKLSNYSREELIGQEYHSLLQYKQSQEIHKEIWDTLKNKKEIWQGILKFVSKRGGIHYLKTTIKPILDENGEIIEYMALRDDISKVMNPKKQLDDMILNLKNPLILYFKLEDFDILEDFYDYVTIELIQDKISEYIDEHIPKEYDLTKVFQLGQGEYALLTESSYYLQNKEKFEANIKAFQHQLKEDTVSFDNIEYDMSILISISYDNNSILENAKLGIKSLLNTTKDFIIANDLVEKATQKAQSNIQTISMIKQALNNYKIISYFQPIVNNQTQQIEKYESLVRLVAEDGKVLSPFFFLDISKKGKYYSQITNMVLGNSFQALENTNVDISMNLSILDIEQESTRNNIFEYLDKHKANTSRVVFELLEDEGVKYFDIIREFITKVKEYGVKIAIDDFGAGYSNFERLLDYQPDILKIDGCLIKNITCDDYSLSVVKTIVTFAQEQNIQTVAEFVEDEETFKLLRDLGVDYTQGYYFGKPQPLEDVETL
jgi:PAS domain S-box-containing protein